jgi:hypothetical protein
MPALKSVVAVFVLVAGISTAIALKQYSRPKHILWVDPGDSSTLDLTYGVGGIDGQPQPPFQFVEEDLSGTKPKVNVTDGRGARWNVKWGDEAHASLFCTRLLWACGYLAPPEYFIARGRIDGARRLRRAGSHIADDGSFENARFQLRPTSPKYVDEGVWKWDSNPFLGTRELQGLKILTLLVSNWDTKNSNLGLFLDDRSDERVLLYMNIDWGSSLGSWGRLISFKKSRWDCDGFAKQSEKFVEGIDEGELEWGFKGRHRSDVTDGITVDDVRWLLQYLGKISDPQIRDALAASGATPAEIDCYSKALRHRIEQLQQVASAPN